MTVLPEYYFRSSIDGAAVFRVDTENRQRRLDMEQIAVVNIATGEIKQQGDRHLSDQDMTAIRHWMERRLDVLTTRAIDDIRRTVEQIHLTAHWAQSKASEAELETVTDQLLLSMHDLRTVLVRRKADRAAGGTLE